MVSYLSVAPEAGSYVFSIRVARGAVVASMVWGAEGVEVGGEVSLGLDFDFRSLDLGLVGGEIVYFVVMRVVVGRA